MTLTLRDAHYFTRQMLGELQPRRWSNAFINFCINNRANDFQSVAGSTTLFRNIPLGQGQYGQEGPLPIDLDQIKNVSFFSGQLYPLVYKEWSLLQTGGFTGSIPLWFYVKTDTTQLTPQTAGSDITVTDIWPQSPQGASYMQVIGVWPIPSAAGNVHVWYSAYHPIMDQPQSKTPIPRPFLDGWCAGAIADCLRNQRAYAEADAWEMRYEKRKEDYRKYTQTHKQVASPSKYGKSQFPWRDSASSSIILVDQDPTGP